MVFPEENIGSGAGKDDASLDGHASLPDVGDFQEVVVVVTPVKEEDIPEPAADDAYEGNGEAQVKHDFMPAPAVFLQKVIGHDAAEDDSQGKEYPVEADRKSADKCDILMH